MFFLHYKIKENILRNFISKKEILQSFFIYFKEKETAKATYTMLLLF